MKKLKLYNCILLSLFFTCLLPGNPVVAQDDAPQPEKLVKLHYFNSNNNLQYLLLETIIKTGKKIQADKNRTLWIFLDSNRAENLISKVVTDEKGKAKTVIPPSLKTTWDALPKHKFIAVAVAAGKEKEASFELDITKAKISLDTASADGARSITVTVQQYQADQWVPAKDVEMKIGIQRLGGILTAGEAETYTTDSTGAATVEFKKDSLPGDRKGNIILVAKVEDNDQFGNLITEKQALWGIAGKEDSHFFDQRTLWSTRFKTPFWLLAMAYSIVIGVWGTLIYLVIQLVKIKKLAV